MYLSVLCLVFQLAVGQNSTKKAIEVFPCPLREHAGANLTTELKNPLVQSLSLCLKINIRSWADMIFLAEAKSFHLYLFPYDSGIGHFTFHDNFLVEFVWINVWSVSGKAWNSICFAFDATRQFFIIAINGEVVKNKVTVSSKAVLDFNLPHIMVAQSMSYSALITDFNAWSRVLTEEEIIKITSGNGSTQAALSEPDVFSWKHLTNVTHKNNCTRLVLIDTDDVAANDARTKYPDIFMIHGQKEYNDSIKICRRFNSHIFQPISYSHLMVAQNLTAKEIFKNHWATKSWVSLAKFQRSGEDSGRDTTVGTMGASALQSWPDGCIYFDIKTQSFERSRCEETRSVLCEVEPQRLVFRLHSECLEPYWASEKVKLNFFLTQRDSNSVAFVGEVGSTTINLIDEVGVIEHKLASSQSIHLATLDTKNFFDLVGLKTWTVNHCGNKSMALIKITNVSIFFKSNYILASLAARMSFFVSKKQISC